ncbi:uncharacterized protein FIBRA_09343 [Fibroporia radiculosa]|uniref:Uncharacterized protein n=1 Tax=Fibroporia radiculosa TaxID=599839 RepID=J7S6C0_9APHY|nr:uncharacterized protein FIBRA_09343 [Fibroporia radiculosa]CCM07024.1 predicted protein [Fibroporia radiculosa]
MDFFPVRFSVYLCLVNSIGKRPGHVQMDFSRTLAPSAGLSHVCANPSVTASMGTADAVEHTSVPCSGARAKRRHEYTTIAGKSRPAAASKSVRESKMSQMTEVRGHLRGAPCVCMGVTDLDAAPLPRPSAPVAPSHLLAPPAVVPSLRQDSTPAASSSTPPSSVHNKQQPQPSALPVQPFASVAQHPHSPETIFAMIKDLGNAFLPSYMGGNANG